jgi:hypothetical protein
MVPPSVLSCPCLAERVAALKTLSKLLTHVTGIKLLQGHIRVSSDPSCQRPRVGLM